MKPIKLGLILACCVVIAACVTPKQIRDEFESSTKGYNRMLRWQEVESAGMRYMEPELRDAFLKSAEEMKKKGVTITDYRILSAEPPEKGKNTAEVLTEFDYYILPSNRIKTLTYRQEWVYHKEDGKTGWKLKSGLPRFE